MCGLIEENIQRNLLGIEYLAFNKVTEIALNMETAKKNSRDIQPSET